jgi:lipopolysaccharide/colanic/teichoic acid biosynthesis glycosyltransferase
MARGQRAAIIRSLVTRLRKLLRHHRRPAAGAPSGLYSVEQFHLALERERARADRNGHHVCLVLLPVPARDGTPEWSPFVRTLRARLRLTDEAGWFDRSHLGVLMPYTSCQGAWHMIEDLCRRLEGRLSGSDCRVYIYPYDPPAGNNGQRERGVPCSTAPRAGFVAESRPVVSDWTGCPRESVQSVCRAFDGFGNEPACVYPLGGAPPIGPPVWQRGLDVVGASLGLLALAPVFLLTALLIRLASPGPVFFKQVRIGRGGKPFVLWKFRTMAANADCAVHRHHVTELIRSTTDRAETVARPMVKLNHDARVIPLGGILRCTCIDELPQLINVLHGEMSLVGPRPPIPYEVDEYLPWQKRRFDAVPGLTGLWQVSGKNQLTFDEMVRLDIQYHRNQSFWMNVKILCRTPHAILQDIGAAWVCHRGRVPSHA